MYHSGITDLSRLPEHYCDINGLYLYPVTDCCFGGQSIRDL